MKTPQNELTLRFDKPIEMITLKELIPIQKNGKPAWKMGEPKGYTNLTIEKVNNENTTFWAKNDDDNDSVLVLKVMKGKAKISPIDFLNDVLKKQGYERKIFSCRKCGFYRANDNYCKKDDLYHDEIDSCGDFVNDAY